MSLENKLYRSLVRKKRKVKTALLTLLVLFANNGWAAATVTAVAASATASALGVDVWPWAIGGFGAAIVFFKKNSRSPVDVVVNSVISIAIGGFVAPLTAAILAHYTSAPALDRPYALAFIMSSMWPFVVPICAQLLAAFRSGQVGGKD